MQSKLNKRSRTFAIIINSILLNDKDLIINDLNSIIDKIYMNYILDYQNSVFIASIIHDNDINDNGEFKTIHAHLVIKFDNQIVASSVLSDILEYTKINANQVSIVPSDCVQLSCQYLIHKNNPNKYQYKRDDIITNNEPRLFNYLAYTEIDIDTLIEMIYNGQNLKEIAIQVGLQTFRKYLFVIRELRKEYLNQNE